MTRLFLIRHGQTIWNHISRYQGHSDIELSDTGRKQAELLAQRLSKVKVTAIYASDLKRAYETAEILAIPHRIQVKTRPDLREINFGVWEGLTFQEIQEKYSDLADRWYQHPAILRIPQGETFEEVKERSYREILKLVEAHDNETIIVVAHGGTIRCIICNLLGIDLNHAFRIRQDNCALNIIDFYDGSVVLTLLNDVNHICPLETEVY